ATDPGALPEPTPVPAGALGVTPAVYHVTRQGMIAPGEAPPRPAKQRPAPKPVPWRTRVRRLLGRVKRRVLRLSGRWAAARPGVGSPPRARRARSRRGRRRPPAPPASPRPRRAPRAR